MNISENIEAWAIAICAGSVPFTIYIGSHIGLTMAILGTVIGCFLLFKY